MAELRKKSFILHLDMLNVLDELDDKQAGKLLKAIREYQLRLVEKDNQDADAEDNWAVNDFVTKIVFAPFKAQFDRDMETCKSGKGHWNWKGGVSKTSHKIRNSAEMKNWRKSVFKRDLYTCQHCGQLGGHLNAHHIKPFSLYPELRFDTNNGLTLCKWCHIELHKKERQWLKTVS